MSAHKCSTDHRFGYRVRGKATKKRRKRANAKGEKTAYKPTKMVLWLGFPEWRDNAKTSPIS